MGNYNCDTHLYEGFGEDASQGPVLEAVAEEPSLRLLLNVHSVPDVELDAQLPLAGVVADG